MDSNQRQHTTIALGSSFANQEDLVYQHNLYTAGQKRRTRVVNSSKKRWSVICKTNSDCNYHLHASSRRDDGEFTITAFEEHTCRRLATTATLTAKTVGRSQLDVTNSTPLSPTSLSRKAKASLGVVLTPSKALRGVQEQKKLLFGDATESYALLEKYIPALRLSDANHVVHCEFRELQDGKREFDKIFWAYGPSIEGFKHCRSFLTVDACHIKTMNKGHMMIAVSLDAEGQIFPVAFSVVGGETLANWRWFLNQLKSIVGERELTIVADRNSGLQTALSEIFVDCHVAYCLEHLKANVRNNGGGTICSYLRKAAECITEEDLTNVLEEMRAISPRGYAYVQKLDFSKLIDVRFQGNRYGHYTSNI
ncbi:hypothetical protein GEMRC1_000572 [Eukaryota sp. GEM-RC1]